MPAQVLSVEVDKAQIKVDSARGKQLVNLAFDGLLKVGDWVLVNADLAVAKINPEEAEEIKKYFN